MKVLICCNKNDFFFTRICASSVRYFYPEIEIFIIKNYGPGYFNSSELEEVLNVKTLDLGKKIYGVSGTRMHFLLSKKFPGEKFLILDSDIVFAGRFLDVFSRGSGDYDFAVSPEYYDNPNEKSLYNIYYNYSNLKEQDPAFKFPGYFFNCGQLVVSSTVIEEEEIAEFYDMHSSPYYKRRDLFPFYDQGLLNYVVGKKEQLGEIKVLKEPFMVWSETEYAKSLDLNKLKEGKEYQFLIHWAGALRVPYLSKMTQAPILIFFEDFYYRAVRFSKVKKFFRKALPIIFYLVKSNYSAFRRMMKFRS